MFCQWRVNISHAVFVRVMPASYCLGSLSRLIIFCIVSNSEFQDVDIYAQKSAALSITPLDIHRTIGSVHK